jgi:hypothetical protein
MVKPMFYIFQYTKEFRGAEWTNSLTDSNEKLRLLQIPKVHYYELPILKVGKLLSCDAMCQSVYRIWYSESGDTEFCNSRRHNWINIYWWLRTYCLYLQGRKLSLIYECGVMVEWWLTRENRGRSEVNMFRCQFVYLRFHIRFPGIKGQNYTSLPRRILMA